MNIIEAYMYLMDNPGSFVYAYGNKCLSATLDDDKIMVWDDGVVVSVRASNLNGWEKEVKIGKNL